MMISSSLDSERLLVLGLIVLCASSACGVVYLPPYFYEECGAQRMEMCREFCEYIGVFLTSFKRV